MQEQASQQYQSAGHHALCLKGIYFTSYAENDFTTQETPCLFNLFPSFTEIILTADNQGVIDQNQDSTG
nr:hypothetical protein [uncultured Halomonas sp.]